MTDLISEKALRDYPEVIRMLKERCIDPDEVYSLEYEHKVNGEPEIHNIRLYGKETRP